MLAPIHVLKRPFFLSKSRTRNRYIAVAVVLLSLIGGIAANAFLSVNSSYVRFSYNSDLSNSRTLGGANIDRNQGEQINIFLSFKDPNIRSVSSYLNPNGQLDSTSLISTSTSAPYVAAYPTQFLKQGDNLLATKIVFKNGYVHHDFTAFRGTQDQ